IMEAGAVACVAKPVSPGHPDYEHQVKDLLQTVKLMAEVKVVRRWPKSRKSASPSVALTEEKSTAQRVQVIGIGSSTGGPPVLQTILTSLPRGFPVPIL